MSADSQAGMNLVRYTALIPSVVLAPVALGAIAVLVILGRSHGQPLLFSALVLAMIAAYVLIGLQFFGAIIANLLALAIYAYGGLVVAMPPDELAYNVLVLLATNVIGGAVAYNVGHTGRREWLEERLLVELAELDGLTAIAIRRRFDRELTRHWAQCAREQRPIALQLADIDCFKAYNDFYGHQAGDEVLRAVARVLAGSVRRPVDTVARYGGEEFAMILPETTRDGALHVAERFLEEVRALGIPHAHSTTAPVLTVSVGVGHVVPAPRRAAALPG